jgi:hypothetical protein
MVACAASRGVPLINMSFGAGDDELYRKFAGYFYSPAMMNMNRELRVVLESLRASGKISSANRVGVLIDGNDDQYQRVYNSTVDPMLNAWKIPHSSYAATASNINGGVLKFSSEGAKVVVFIAPSGIGEVLFMTAAEQQQYRPFYGIG